MDFLLKRIMPVFDNSEPGGAGAAPATPEPATTPEPSEPQPEPAPVEPVVPAEPAAVPVAAVKDERRRRQEAEKQAQEAREQAAYYKGLAERTPAPEPATHQVASIPKLDDFDSFEEFEAAKEQHLIATVKNQTIAEFEQRQNQTAIQTRAQKAVEDFNARITTVAATEPDILDIVADARNGRIPMSQIMGESITASEAAPQMLRYLSANPQEAARLAQMEPIQAARELGKIEGKILSAPKPVPPRQVSQAPEPITPVNPAGSVNVFDPEKTSMEDYYKKRTAELHPRR